VRIHVLPQCVHLLDMSHHCVCSYQ
jgi:hypothetical protein